MIRYGVLNTRFSSRFYSLKKKIKPKTQSIVSEPTEKMPVPQPLVSMPFKNIPKLDFLGLKSDSIINSMTLIDLPFKSNEYPIQLGKTFNLFQQKHLLYRSITKQLYDLINNNKSVFLLDGRSGVGKSAILLQLAQLLSSNFIIYIPNAHQWTIGRYPYHPEGPVFDQPDISKQVLSNILTLNQHILENYPSIKQFISEGINNSPSKTLIQLLEKHLDSMNPILLVDQINALYSPIEYKSKDGNSLPIEQFPVMNLFKKYFDNNSITAIGATSYSDTRIRPQKYNHSLSIYSGAHRIQIECFNRQELKAILFYYRELGYIYEDNLNENEELHSQYLNRKYYATGGNGQALFHACAYDNIY